MIASNSNDLSELRGRAKTLLDTIDTLVKIPSDITNEPDSRVPHDELNGKRDLTDEQNPIAILQTRVEDLELNLAVTMKTNMALGQLVSELQQELAQTSGQLASIPRLQQQVDNLYRAINEMLSTGCMGNPNRS